jgi:transmembrane sensor
MNDPRIGRGQASGPLPERLVSVLTDPVDERSVPRMWRRISERRATPASRPGMVVAGALLGAGAAILIMTALLVAERWVSPRAGQATAVGALVRNDGSPVGTIDVAFGKAPAVVDLSDRSRIVVAEGSRLEALASSAREFIVRLSVGTAVFDVEPFGPRRWVVEAGLASVEVVGTRFSVNRRIDSVRVEVERGSVLVRGATVPDGVIRIEAGGSIDVGAPRATTLVSSESAPPAPSTAIRRSHVEPSDDDWRGAAARGDYANAYGNLGAEGLRRETARAASGEDLFALADVARLSGHPAEAVAPLERLEREFASSPRAPLAAVTLGRIELDLGHPERASRAFERALALHVPAGLEEDVYARLVEAYVKAGKQADARAMRDAYEQKYPGGRRRVDIESWLAR